MNSPFKFLRRVRIHGGECGAVARALHHEVKGLSLYQADLEKSSGSTNERKQMSTKTTLKRVALVAVSALGFGLLASTPSQAANTTTSAFSKSQTLNASYLTVVGAAAQTGTASGFFYVDITNESVATNAGSVVGLSYGYETMTVLATTAPTGATVADIAIRPVKQESAIGTTGNTLRFTTNVAETWTAGEYVLHSTRITNNESRDFNPTTANPTGAAKRYWFAVSTHASRAVGAGYFNLRIRTNTADSRTLTDLNIQVRFVSTIADAGATIAIAGTGSLFTGETLTYQANRYYTATLAGPNNDRIQVGRSVSVTNTDGTESAAVSTIAPAMTAALTSAAGVDRSANLEVTDDGDSGQDYFFSSTTAVTGSTLTSMEIYQDARNLANGVYGITHKSSGSNGFPTLTALSTDLLRVRLTDSSAEKTFAVTTGAARTALTSVQTKLDATGVAAADAAYTSTTASSTATKAYTLPLSVKSVTLYIDSTIASQNITTTTTWSGNYASANVTPATTTALTTATDGDGTVTRVITNSSPLAGAVATVVISGFADLDNTVTVTLTWAAAVATTVTVLEPVSGIHTKLKGTTNFVVEVEDQFGNPMAGEVVQPIVGGSATSGGNYSATTTYATVTTDSKGLATWSLTDATGINDGTDSITFRAISNSVTSSPYTITYKTTVAAVSSFLNYFDNDMSATANVSYPTAGIYGGTAGDTGKLSLLYNVNLSDGTLDNVVDGSSDALVQFRVMALTSAGVPANGAAVTITAGTGGHVLSDSGLPLSSITKAVGATGYVSFIGFATAPGAIKFTITSGTVSTEMAMWVAEPTGTAARTIAISGASTGVSNGDGVPMTVTVKDRYGNLVGNVGITAAASGVGSFMGGSTQQSYTTDATGTYSFLATSAAAAGGSGTFNVSINTANSDATSLAGYYGSTAVDSTVAAGVSSASKVVTFTAGKSASTVAAEAATAAAEAASDAAAEAIDAANAATDAANLAAEAADAATVAAEEARDAADAATAAVEELATQVATLMAALKAQITTLANTVAKIAKKVKA